MADIAKSQGELKMAEAHTSLTVSIPIELAQAIEAEVLAQGRPKSWVVRDILSAAIPKRLAEVRRSQSAAHRKGG